VGAIGWLVPRSRGKGPTTESNDRSSLRTGQSINGVQTFSVFHEATYVTAVGWPLKTTAICP